MSVRIPDAFVCRTPRESHAHTEGSERGENPLRTVFDAVRSKKKLRRSCTLDIALARAAAVGKNDRKALSDVHSTTHACFIVFCAVSLLCLLRRAHQLLCIFSRECANTIRDSRFFAELITSCSVLFRNSFLKSVFCAFLPVISILSTARTSFVSNVTRSDDRNRDDDVVRHAVFAVRSYVSRAEHTKSRMWR